MQKYWLWYLVLVVARIVWLQYEVLSLSLLKIFLALIAFSEVGDGGQSGVNELFQDFGGRN
jgi:hypothetical protein